MAKRFVVYTIVVGNYDEVTQPLVIDNRFDYVLFSDTHNENSIGVWDVRPIDYKTDNNFIKSRFPRLQPEKVLAEYDAWLYIDGTLQITSQIIYDRCIDLYERGIEFAANKHHCRDNVYEEISAIIRDEGKEPHDYDCLTWYWYLKEQGYSDENHIYANFYESGIIYRTHTGNVQQMNDIWWDSCINHGVRRDQFSLPFALWKVPSIKEEYFLPYHENVWNNSGYIKYTRHTKKRILKPLSAWEKIRYRCWRAGHGSEELYTHLFDEAYRISTKHPLLALHLWTFFAMFRYGLKVLVEMVKHRLLKRKIQ